MKTFDELKGMTSSQLEVYRDEEVEKLIQSAPPEKQLKLRALYAKVKNTKVKDDFVRAQKAFTMMMGSVDELNQAYRKAGF